MYVCTGGCHTYSDTCSSSEEGDLRFSPQAHATSTQGVVEMCNDYSGYGWEWGAITDSTAWTDNDARVVCRQLGLSTSGLLNSVEVVHFGSVTLRSYSFLLRIVSTYLLLSS